MRLRTLTLGSLLLLSALGCSSSDAADDAGNPENPGENQDVLQIFSWWTAPGEAEALAALVKTYKDAHEGARVSQYDNPTAATWQEVLGEKIEEDAVTYPAPWRPAPRTLGDPAAIREAIALLAGAERPVVLAGSGVWWSDGARSLHELVDATGIPFYTTPISRGLIPEDHALAFLNARSKAFTEADVVLAVGTRFNWMVQFGRPPRFAADMKVIHVDINPAQLGHNRAVDVPPAHPNVRRQCSCDRVRRGFRG